MRHAPLITADEEEKLWESSVLNITTPKGLQRAVFYYVGKCFCIRGGQEQRNLGPSNFRFMTTVLCCVRRAWVEKPFRRNKGFPY